VEPCSSLLLVAPFELVREELVQSQHCPISNHHVSESVELIVHSVWNSDLVEYGLDEVAEVLSQRWRQSLVVAARRQRFVGCGVVAPTERCERSALAGGEAECK